MIDEKIMSDNAMITQEDYMRYEEYISSLVDVGDSKIVYISGLEHHSYEPIKGAKADNIIEILENASDKLNFVMCPKCHFSGYSIYENVCPQCGCVNDDE